MKFVKALISAALAVALTVTAAPLMKQTADAAGLVIALDPGHGGNDPGATGAVQWGGKNESIYNLEIALYARERLQQYSGVTVFMTRDTDVFVELHTRATTAYDAGADTFVSIHNNSSTASSANGTQVYIPNANYRPAMRSKSLAIANLIQQHLLNDVGIRINASPMSINYPDWGAGSNKIETYPDGSTADQHTVIARAKLCGTSAAMIVENCFTSNQSDVQNYLLNSDKVKASGYAIADGIAEYFGLSVGGSYINTIDYNNSSVSKVGERVEQTITLKKGATTSFQLSGWSVHSEGVKQYEWNINNTSWGVLPGSFRSDVASAQPTYTNCTTLNAFSQTVDAGGFNVGLTTIYARGLTKQDNYYDIAILNVIVMPEDGSYSLSSTKTRYALNEEISVTAKGPASGAWVGLYGLNDTPLADSFYYKRTVNTAEATFDIKSATSGGRTLTPGEYKLVLFVDDGYIFVTQKNIVILDNRHSSLDSPKASQTVAQGVGIATHGWALHPDGIAAFEYRIDNGAYSALASQTREDVMATYPAYEASCSALHGFADTIPTSALAAGEHTVTIRVRTGQDDRYQIGSFTFTVSVAESGEITAGEGSSIAIDKTGARTLVKGARAGVGAADIAAMLEGNCTVTRADGTGVTGGVRTGDIVRLYGSNSNLLDEGVLIVTGDANSDGAVNGKDLLRARKQSFDGYQLAAVDYDSDGNITSYDIAQLLNDVKIG